MRAAAASNTRAKHKETSESIPGCILTANFPVIRLVQAGEKSTRQSDLLIESEVSEQEGNTL